MDDSALLSSLILINIYLHGLHVTINKPEGASCSDKYKKMTDYSMSIGTDSFRVYIQVADEATWSKTTPSSKKVSTKKVTRRSRRVNNKALFLALPCARKIAHSVAIVSLYCKALKRKWQL